MTSFGWKRKVGEKLCKTTVTTFNSDTNDDAEIENNEVDWLTLAPKRRAISLEDAVSKSERLKAEGAVLAESERFWEAIKKWDEAMQLTPHHYTIVEMKAQALMAVGEVLPAVQVAEKVVELAPTWWVGHQTLGRALANVGEVGMALKSFSRAVHLNPADKELWLEDLMWTRSLLERKRLAATSTEGGAVPESSVTVTEVTDCHSTGSDCDKSSLVVYSRADGDLDHGAPLDTSSACECRHLKSVPTNYVQMRDPT